MPYPVSLYLLLVHRGSFRIFHYDGLQQEVFIEKLVVIGLKDPIYDLLSKCSDVLCMKYKYDGIEFWNLKKAL